jgi:hypothetical protein
VKIGGTPEEKEDGGSLRGGRDEFILLDGLA